jgi:hypothetical protein
VVRWVLLLISVLLQDGVEGIVANNLSETLKSNRLDAIEVVGWGNLKSDSLDLIDWNIDVLRVLLEGSIVGTLGGDKAVRSWSKLWLLSESSSSFWCLRCFNLNSSFVCWVFVVLVVLFVVLLVVMFGGSLLETDEIFFFKVSLLSLLIDEVLANQILNLGFDHVFDLTISHSLGTFA